MPTSIPAELATVRVALVVGVESVVTLPVVEPEIVTAVLLSHAVVGLLRVTPAPALDWLSVVPLATPLPVMESPVSTAVDAVPRVAASASAVWLPDVVTELVAEVGKPVPVRVKLPM